MSKFSKILVASALALAASGALADDVLCPSPDLVRQAQFVSVAQQSDGWKVESNSLVFQGNNWKVGLLSNTFGTSTPDVIMQRAQGLLESPNVSLQAKYFRPGSCGYFFLETNQKYIIISAYQSQ
jgi:hypothetical protein